MSLDVNVRGCPHCKGGGFEYVSETWSQALKDGQRLTIAYCPLCGGLLDLEAVVKAADEHKKEVEARPKPEPGEGPVEPGKDKEKGAGDAVTKAKGK